MYREKLSQDLSLNESFQFYPLVLQTRPWSKIRCRDDPNNGHTKLLYTKKSWKQLENREGG